MYFYLIPLLKSIPYIGGDGQKRVWWTWQWLIIGYAFSMIRKQDIYHPLSMTLDSSFSGILTFRLNDLKPLLWWMRLFRWVARLLPSWIPQESLSCCYCPKWQSRSNVALDVCLVEDEAPKDSPDTVVEWPGEDPLIYFTNIGKAISVH